jgi:hypothetical protein
MHAVDMMEYAHLLVMDNFVGLSETVYETPGASGHWSVREILAHLTSYEALLVDVLSTICEPTQKTPILNRWLSNSSRFNDDEVHMRRNHSIEELIEEYAQWHSLSIDMLIHIPVEKMRELGLLGWYGAEYDLEDFLVYTYYAHKREHCAQVAAFAERFEKTNVLQGVLNHI